MVNSILVHVVLLEIVAIITLTEILLSLYPLEPAVSIYPRNRKEYTTEYRTKERMLNGGSARTFESKLPAACYISPTATEFFPALQLVSIMPNNNHNEPENELDMFEALAAQIFGGTFSVMKEVMQGGTGHIMINDDQTAAGPPVWDDGSDFRRLAKTNGSKGQAISIEGDNKEKSISDRRVESRRISLSNPDQPSAPVVSTSYQQPTPIFDLLFNSHPARLSEGDTVIFGGGNEGGSVCITCSCYQYHVP